MNRFLTCTAVGLFLGLSPALAETQLPADDAQTPPAINQPSQIPEVMPDPGQPSDPAKPIPGNSSQALPAPAQPGDETAPLPKSSQAPQSVEPMLPGGDVSPAPKSSEAPQSIEPAAPKSAAVDGAQFLKKQETSDWLATNLIGQSVYDSQDKVIGDINDLVADNSGKVVAVLIGTGGFLGLGEKDVALRFEDLRIARDEDNSVKVIANLNEETLASAPDYQTLPEQTVTVGSNKGDREDAGDQRGSSDTN